MTSNEMLNKLNNGEAVKAVYYKRVGNDLKKLEDRVGLQKMSSLCRVFLKQKPNITLVGEPYIDFRYDTGNLDDRRGFCNMYIELDRAGDINLLIVDDIFDLVSSFKDLYSVERLFRMPDIIVYDLSHMELYDSFWKLLGGALERTIGALQ